MNESEIPPEVIKSFEEQNAKLEQERKKLKQMGIYINYVKPVEFKGKRVWALGNSIYYQRRNGETYHEFIIDILKMTLGKEWWIEQMSAQRKHFIMQCFLHYFDWKKNNFTEKNKIREKLWRAEPDGWTKSLISLAFDIASLIHTDSLPTHLLNRLRNRGEYQGARYEVAVAAIFSRLDCEIEFLDDLAQDSKHCEFYATHRKSKIKLAIEAKSRHRQGVLHTEGILDDKKISRGDVQRLINRALEKEINEPFIIFIDLNSPITPETNFEEKRWYKDVLKTMKRIGTPTEEKPDLFNAIFFTNYSFHYQEKTRAASSEILTVLPQFTKYELPNGEFVSMLHTAAEHYGQIPDFQPEPQ